MSGYKGPIQYPAAPAKVSINAGWGKAIKATTDAVTPIIPQVKTAARPTFARRRVEKVSLLSISPNQKTDVARLAPAML